MDRTQSDYLSGASDLEDTDGEPFTDGETYTDNEDLDEAFPSQDAARPAARPARSSRATAGAALARSSEPASGHHSPAMDPEPQSESHTLREIPPLMHVPEPISSRRESYSPPHTAAPEEEDSPSHRSYTDSDFSATDPAAPTTPSDGPPDFIAPDPPIVNSVRESPPAEEEPAPVTLSAIEEKLQEVNIMMFLMFKCHKCFYSLYN